jgi:IclR family KDG regulon transcriptional repressor
MSLDLETAQKGRRHVAVPRPVDTEDAEQGSVKCLRKALGILQAVATAEHGPTIAEVARHAGVARPTAYRIVQTLIAEGHLVQDPVDGRLAIGFSVLPLAASLLDRNRLRLEALPHLQRLAQHTGQRVNLGILNRNRVMYLAGIEKPSLPTIYSRFGKTVPAHCNSLGKAILAYLPPEELQALIRAAPLTVHTPNTIRTLVLLQRELNETKSRGYALDRGEHVAGSFCIANAVFDARNRPIAAIGLTGQALGPLLEHAPLLAQIAELISHQLQS